MRLLVRLGLVAVVLFGAAAAAYGPVSGYWRVRNLPQYKTVEISEGEIIAVVNSTGTVKPVLSVQVGSFVSGPIQELHVEFNQHVKKDDLMCQIDPLIYKSNFARDEAVFKTKEADVNRVEALLALARRDEDRSKKLRAESEDYISNAEMDQYKFNRMSLEAQLAVAIASVKQAKGQLDYTEAQLKYTKITAPCDGIVIDRKIQPGQTIAAQFQTPELFTIAPDMEKKMHVHASVDEADIGLIKEAQLRKQPVRFTVDAYPDDLFEGEIEQVRMSSTTTQNVVTYPVIVAAPNPELKLMPGMTASLSFQTDAKKDVLRIPTAALRFYPDIRQVRPEDKSLLDGSVIAAAPEDSSENDTIKLSAMEKAEAGKSRNRRHVWIVNAEGLLQAVAIQTGISDSKFSELVSGDLKAGQALVTGVQQARAN